VATAGKASPPVSRYCPGTHRWETFLAIRLTGEAPVIDTDAPLIEKPDVAKACSAEVLAQHSLDPEATRSWRRDAWPVQDGAVWLLHCIAQPKSGSSTGAAFKP
jgi:serine/threonine-protein kinase